MTRKHLLFFGTALFVMGTVPGFAESLPNHSVREKALYSEAILEDGNLDKVTGRLSKVATDKNKPKAERAEALLVASNLHWRYGARDKALAAIDKALKIDSSAAIVLQKARLLDAAGKADAVNWYEKALLLVDTETEGKIRLRLAIMKAGEKWAIQDDLKDLISFAKKRDQNFQNRAAVTLALMGFQEQSLDLYKVTGKAGTASFRQYIRLAEWAIRADKPELAGKYTVQALENADLERDRLYGLAILVESHRMNDTLDDILIYFEGQKNLFPEAYQVWVDLLREKGRFGEALALFKKNGADNSSGKMRRRLIRLYKEAGRAEEMVGEYRDLIKKEPDEVNWTAALSEYYLGLGESEEATKLWQAFLKANKDDGFILLKGAAPMSNMGYDVLASKTLEDHMNKHGVSSGMLFFLFEMNKERGRLDEAEEMLSRLDKALGADAAERVDLAEGYERIRKLKKALHIWEELKKNGGGLGYAEKMSVARLYDKQGEKKQALNIWKDLWYDVKTPARRSFVESRMMMLGEEVGELANMTIDLEERLAGGTADTNASALLVRIYTQQQDQLSALEIINEYFSREGGTEGLIEQAKVYRLLRDYAGFEKINHKLIEVDPENKGEYLRSIILGLIDQGGKQNIRKIFDTLVDLRTIDEEAVGGEFEAGVLVLAGLADAAIKAYRRTMANDMSGDNYLLVSDLLKKQGRVDEAVTLLQYVVEEAEDDKIFVVAIDGLLSMLASDSSGPGPGENDRATLIWVRRLILERLAQGTDKIYLYHLLAEVSHELQDEEGRFTAVENTLSLSESLRSSTLRQLMTMSRSVGRHLVFGRRLVALNEELPPEVYTGLGKVFLDQKDPVGAMKAFNIAIDASDRSDILIETAVLFENADFEDQALDQYSKALVSNNNDLSVLLQIGLLRELKGQNGLANSFFAKALHILLLHQPIRVKPKEDAPVRRKFRGQRDDTVTGGYTRNYRTLLQGYLASWPRDTLQAAANFKMLEDMLGQEISRVAGSVDRNKPGKLAEHLRLDRMARFVRRVAFATANYELADKMDRRILDIFSDDENFIKSLIRERIDWGLYTSARSLIRGADKKGELQALLSITPDGEDFISFDRALKAANENGNFEKVKNISLLNGKQNEMMAVARGMVKAGFAGGEALIWGKAHLDARNYRNLCRHIIGVIRRGKDPMKILGQVLFSDILFQLEEATGERVFSEAALAKITKNYDPKIKNSLVNLIIPYIGKRASPENSLDLLDKIFFGQRGALYGGIDTWGIFHRESVEPELARKMTELVIGYINKATLGKGDAASITDLLLRSDIHSANMDEAKNIYDVLLAKDAGTIYDVLLAKDGETINVFEPAYLLKKGKVEEAAAAFLKVRWAKRTNKSDSLLRGGEPYMQSLNALFLLEHLDAVQRQLDIMGAKLGQSEEFINFRFNIGGNILHDLHPDLDILKSAVDKYPENEEYRARLFTVYRLQENRFEAMNTIRRLFEDDPKNMIYRAGLFAALLEFDRQAEALALNEASPENMLAPDFFTELRMKELRKGQAEWILPYFTLPSDTDISNILRTKEKILEEALKAKDSEKARKSLRGLWQKVTEVYKGGRGMMFSAYGNQGYKAIVTSKFFPAASVYTSGAFFPGEDIAQKKRGNNIFDTVVDYDFAPHEFEDYLRGLDVRDRDFLYEFYPYLIKAYKKHAMAEKKWLSLNKAVSGMTASGEDYTLWLTFLNEEEKAVSGEVVKILDQNLARYNNLSDYQLRSMARLYASADEMDQAVEVYRLLALKTLIFKHDTYSEGFGSSPSSRMFTALGFVDEVKRYLPPAQARELVEKIIRLVQPNLKGEEAQQTIYQRFIIRALGKVHRPDEVLKQVGDVKEGSAEYLFDYALLLLKAHRQDEALRILKKASFQEQKIQNNIIIEMMGRQQTNEQSNKQYSGMIGVAMRDFRSSSFEQAIPFFSSDIKQLFPAMKGIENIAWLSHAAGTMKDWVKEKNGILFHMLFIAHQMHEAGATIEIEQVMADISDILFQNNNMPVQLVSLAISVSEKIGHPLNLAVAQKLLLEGRIQPEFAGNIIERTLKLEGPAAALVLGKKVSKYTHHDGVLVALISLGQAMGDEGVAEHWHKIRAEEQKARETLKAYKMIEAQ